VKKRTVEKKAGSRPGKGSITKKEREISVWGSRTWTALASARPALRVGEEAVIEAPTRQWVSRHKQTKLLKWTGQERDTKEENRLLVGGGKKKRKLVTFGTWGDWGAIL